MKIVLYLFLIILPLSTTIFAQNNVDVNAQFPGGNRGLSEYWSKNYKIPFKERLKDNHGEGVISFTIGANGHVSNIRIKKSLNTALDMAAIVAVEKMPIWKPAYNHGQPISSVYEMSFWVKGSIWYGDVETIDAAEVQDLIKDRGISFGLFSGLMYQTKDFGDYFNPIRFAMGLNVSYSLKKWTLGLEYDVFAISKVKRAFLIEGKTANTSQRISPFNIYFPISYRFDLSSKLKLSPYLAPTINHFDIEERTNGRYEPIGSATTFSVSFGVFFDKLLTPSATILKTHKAQLMTPFIRTRLNINPMNFVPSNSTPFKGTAVSLTFGLHLSIKRGNLE